MAVEITSLSDRPDLADEMWAMSPSIWPVFMTKEPTSLLYYERCDQVWPEFILIASDAGRIVGRAMAVPFAFGDPIAPERAQLPDAGWAQVIRWAIGDLLDGRPANCVSALEISVLPEARGAGLSGLLLAGLRDVAARVGSTELIAPVRPTEKHLEPLAPIEEYAFRTRDDGLPEDTWLRVHVRAGGRIERVARNSMVVTGSLPEWREWTGLAFDSDGPWIVPGALEPVICSLDVDRATYVEPNVWVRHYLDTPR